MCVCADGAAGALLATLQLQAIARGLAVRRKYKEMMDYYRQNEAKIIHAQAIWRGKLARTQYQNLSTSCLAESAFAQGPLRRAVPRRAAISTVRWFCLPPNPQCARTSRR